MDATEGTPTGSDAAMEVAFTAAAEAQMRRLLARRHADFVRLSGALECGCGKVGYRVDVEEAPSPGDRIVPLADGRMKLLVGPESLAYAPGSTVDWSDDLMHTGFVVANDRVQTWCGRAPRE